MKKALLTILIAALLLGCGAPAFAAINLPGNLTVIGEEAFMNASLDWMVTIPDGVKSIGARAFAGSVAAFAAVDSTAALAVDPTGDFTGGDTATFERGEFRQSKFYVLTAARYHQMSWGRTNGFNYFPLFIRDGVSTDSTGFMAADINRDGRLTQHELFLYIKACEEDPAYPIDQDVQEYPRNSNYVLFMS